jgi:hypothetical protein
MAAIRLSHKLGDAEDVGKGEARHVDVIEVAEILKKANQSGLVHLSLYMPDHEKWYMTPACVWAAAFV